jgi:hypothetical protein
MPADFWQSAHDISVLVSGVQQEGVLEMDLGAGIYAE